MSVAEYDYLIVGAGLYGCVFAEQMSSRGKRCLVIERREHIGGNIYCEEIEGIQVHRYGAHIFHTSDEEVWAYINRFSPFNHYINSPIAIYGDELYNLPFNMNTFSKLWNIRTPSEAKEIIQRQIAELSIGEPANLEEQALKLAGRDVYEKLIKGYTEKQWGRPCKELPAFIIQRIPLRFTFDNNYFSDRYQGIPMEGYNAIAEKLLAGSEVLLNTDYAKFRQENPGIAARTVYSGQIDAFFDFCLGQLEYRSLTFETRVLDQENWQGNAVVNYTAREVPYTRSIEHKHFLFGTQPKTVVSWEYPAVWGPGREAYYPVNDEKNQNLYQAYQQLARTLPDVIFGGRLGSYRYYNMDQTIRAALDAALLEAKMWRRT